MKSWSKYRSETGEGVAGRGIIVFVFCCSSAGRMLAVFSGLGVGLVLSVGLSSVLARWSIGKVDDPVVLVAAVGTLLLSTGIATVIPARRATAIEPTIALRVE
jgi:ABC-type antimicrobial peptide transport system permease subunit